MALTAVLLPVLSVVVAAPASAEEQEVLEVPPTLEADLSAAEERTLAAATSGDGVPLAAFVTTPDGPEIVTLDAGSRTDAAAAVSVLGAQPSVEAVELSGVVRPTGATYAHLLYGNTMIRSEAARAEADDPLSDVVVAVLDTGVAPHPELVSALVPGRNFTDSPGGELDATDRHGHGTHVAGTIAADAGSDVEGVAHGVRIMPVKVLGDGGPGLDSWISSGILWAADHGADVINMSLGRSGSSSVMSSAVAYARSKGVTVIAAAGNKNSSAMYSPAGLPGVVAVSAVDQTRAKASFSNYGAFVDLAGPGVDILSTYPGDGLVFMSGTSMASPHVAGVAALVEATAPGLSPDQVEQALVASGTDLGTPGRDDHFGHGLVDAVRAVRAAEALESGGEVPANRPPTATTDSLVLGPGSAPATVAVTANDTDADGDDLSVTSVSAATHGAVTVQDDGHVVYTPAGDLARGTTDRFTYTVSDGRGGSATAAVAVQHEAVEAPSAPGIGAPTPASAAVHVVWSAPVDDGGAPITGYRVHTYRAGSLVTVTEAPSTVRSATVTGLSNGSGYTFAVAAVNAAGTGAWSAASATVTPRTAPSAPAIGRPTAGNSAVTVRWAAPTDTGGAAITGYTVRAHLGTKVVKTVIARAGSTSLTVPGLVNGTGYRFTVTAVNAAGTGRASALSATVTPRR